MHIEVINKTRTKIRKKQVQKDAELLIALLKKRSALKSKSKLEQDLNLVFLGKASMRQVNLLFRGKDKVTDVLSFSDEEILGELLLCIPQIKKQAIEHKLTSRAELNYMILHGILHLLGYDHELGEKQAKQMFRIQDEVFDRFCVLLKK